jgi:hypothetical protein
MAYCGKCGAERVSGEDYCRRCGQRFEAEPAAAAEPAMESSGDEPFPDWGPFAAGVAAFFLPFISLIVALVMRASEQRPKRRSFLKNWAIASGAWMCTGWLIFLIVFTSGGGGFGGGCQGGADPFAVPTSFASTDNKHWWATVPCRDGGSTTRPARPGEVP